MRFIPKTELGSDHLNRQNDPDKQGIPQTSAEATARWSEFGKKKQVRNKLLPQQLGLCGYTEFNINDFRSKSSAKKEGCHIEHIKPKKVYPQQTFNYDNLIISVLDDLNLQQFRQDIFIDEQPNDDNSHQLYFGGHRKGDVYDPALFVSPTDADCGRYFIFIEDSGEITPAPSLTDDDKAKAIYTIDLLNLNHPYLKNQRRKRMAEIIEDIDDLEDIEKQRTIIRADIAEDAQGQIASFPSAVSSLVSGV